MAWNPFRAIGNAIGRVFGRGEAPSAPEPAPSQAPEPPAVSEERRGGLGGLWDRVTGADRRREEETRERQEAERQIQEQRAELERQRQELEQQRQEVERQAQALERQRQELERQAQGPAPTPTTPVPTQGPAPERDLPKFATGDGLDYQGKDERAFGVDSDIGRELENAVADFVAERGGLDGLGVDAREWLQSPTISEIFSDYWKSGGFSADQVLGGMTNISNIQIIEGEDGDIHVEFDYDAEVEGYEVSGHASS